ncbi:hypothetical protein E2C01_055654 [Portunus trituberculatus]|uniref:Gustatory receptor n=1 Tax=Portunus trituberculatus TaxID=210409 RepID=A0A5B7GN23_PORTR|nr:hypothetical protein [Portunus trituberculatus]
MEKKSRHLLLWTLAMLRVAGGLPYTWTASGYWEGRLQLRRRRALLAWSGVVVLYLLTICIYRTKNYMLETAMFQDVSSALFTINNLLVNFTPTCLIFFALCKANKMVSMVQLISLVQAQATCDQHTTESHINIAIILLATMVCTAGAPVSLFILSINEQYHFNITIIHQEVIFSLIVILVLGIMTVVMLEITDLTERLTTCLAGSEDSRNNADQTPFFDKIFIKIDCLVSHERSLRMLNEAARKAEDYLRMPLLLIGGEGFLNILFTFYMMTQSTTPVHVTHLLFLASFIGRSWCAMHVIDLYKSKVMCVPLFLVCGGMGACALQHNR